ncbi:uncharacterized protein TRUGW13939_08793 [Talaromyces rugulosus]|uniref:AAA+ ATPase domain-containing protein n=1 Tax=Talaromyces rugulosus TaxID=121627 RepID=A0A7H8R7B7_TALRU|nr:uncharacterized protein TRUGW13939_08793 [Talaromyces rugulosus]QKX61641.1 hypothetical protein TRUGW13939_08793 [Talaromyces rugulosus]
MHAHGDGYMPMRPPMSIMDVFFPGFSTVTASAQQLLVGDENTFVRLLCMGVIFATFVQYATAYAKKLIDRHFGRTIHIPFTDESYDMVIHWIRQQLFSRKAHSVIARIKTEERTFVQDQPAREKPLCYSPWQGSFNFSYNGHQLVFHTRANEYSEDITITAIGTSSDILFEWMEECRAQYLAFVREKVTIFQHQDGIWKINSRRAAKDISTVIMDENLKYSILKDIQEFLDDQKWYINRGMLYKRGYLLHGDPGTGKSSFCWSIASHFKLEIYSLNLSNLTDNTLSRLFTELPSRCIVFLEDVDAVGLEREIAGKAQSRQNTPRSEVSLSGLLNVLDGVSSPEGRILMMSTNRPHALDEALIRPGRVDKKILFKCADSYMAAQLFRKIFQKQPNEDKKLGDVGEDELERLTKAFASQIPEEEFSPATIENFLLQHKHSPVHAVDGVQEWVVNERKAAKAWTVVS